MLISIILFIIVVGVIFAVKGKKDNKELNGNGEVIEEVLKDKVAVIIELEPTGTKRNPVKCLAGEKINFIVRGYADHKKTEEVKLHNNDISWHKSCPVGRFDFAYGVENVYTAPSANGYRDIWVKYIPKMISAKAKVLVGEVKDDCCC